MSLARIRDEYRVPARLGQRVSVHLPDEGTLYGTIAGAQDQELVVNFDKYGPQIMTATSLTYLKEQS